MTLVKTILVFLALAATTYAEDKHHYWTKHTTSTEPRETLKHDLRLVYTGVSDTWIHQWNNELGGLWMAPSKGSDVVGYFRATISVVPLNNSKAVCDIVDPVISDYVGGTRMRWAFKRNVSKQVGITNELTYLGNTWFPRRTPVPYKRSGVAWIYGLHGWESLHTPVPAGGYFTPVSLDITQWAECAYKVGGYKLKFQAGHPTHNPGSSKIDIKNISMMLWSSEEEGEPYWYMANTNVLGVRTVAVIYVVQRKVDANLDGKVNGKDISHFIQAFNNPPLYESLHFGVPVEFNCDVNWDGTVNGLDVGPFSSAVLNGGVPGDYWDSIGYQ